MMTSLSLSPGLAVAMSVMVAMVTIVLMILCIKRKKSVELARENSCDPDTAFNEYRKQQQQAISLEDLATDLSTTSHSREGFTTPEDLVNTHSSGVVTLAGAELIDQFPDQQHVYRLDPTDNGHKSGNQPGNTATDIGDHSNNIHRLDATKNGQNPGNRPVTIVTTTRDQTTTQKSVTAEYAKVNKKHASLLLEPEYAKVNKNKKQAKTSPLIQPEVQNEENVFVASGGFYSVEVPENHNTGISSKPSGGGTSSLQVPESQHTDSLSAPTRHVSSKSTASDMSDFLDCSEFKREQPAK